MNRDIISLKPLFDIEPLLGTIEQGSTVITSNLRLSRKIREAWNTDCVTRGLDTWATPTILPLDTWLQTCWLALVDAAYPPALSGVVASTHQQRLLWEQAISADPQFPADANPENFSDLARQGYSLMRQWQVPNSLLAAYAHNGLDYLLRWAGNFDQLMRDHSLIDNDMRTAIVRKGFEETKLAQINQITLVGFQSISPLLKETLTCACRKLITYTPNKKPGNLQMFTATDRDNELATAAQWAYEKAVANPEERIGIIIPQLNSLHKSAERIFRNQFQPDYCLPTSGYRPSPFNISVGISLAEAPVVSAALGLLTLMTRQVSTTQLYQILNSPFWSSPAKEQEIRCQSQKKLRKLGLRQISPGRFRQLLHRLEVDDQDAIPESTLSYRLARLSTLCRSVNGNQSHARWGEIFKEVLDILGWPGARTPDSLEYQQLEQWRELLESFCQLDDVQPAVSLDNALKWLSCLAKDAIFHPETDDAQIQILGTLEGAGLRFDRLWVMNIDNRCWPEAISPHPLLPASLQRELEMPKSSPARELALSNELFELFSTSAGEVVFSYARREGDISIQPSLLLDTLLTAYKPKHSPHSLLSDFTADSSLEIVEDTVGPPLDLEASDIRGGTRLLADQAGCPFNAFARWRLNAEPLEEPAPGLSPQMRGILIHNSLEVLWRQLGSQEALLNLEADQLQHTIDSALNQGFEELFLTMRELSKKDFGERLLSLEKQRMHNLIARLLEEEKDRTPFSVESTEKMLAIDINGLKLKLRVDRIDRLPDGRQIIIDYKTGNITIANTASERITDPQLPLYALATEEEPAAVTYSVINRTQTGFVGLAAEPDIIPGCRNLASLGLPDSWQDTLSLWQEGIATLVAEISRGEAEVVFYNRNAISYGGAYAPLNRLEGMEDLRHYKSQLEKGTPP